MFCKISYIVHNSIKSTLSNRENGSLGLINLNACEMSHRFEPMLHANHAEKLLPCTLLVPLATRKRGLDRQVNSRLGVHFCVHFISQVTGHFVFIWQYDSPLFNKWAYRWTHKVITIICQVLSLCMEWSSHCIVISDVAWPQRGIRCQKVVFYYRFTLRRTYVKYISTNIRPSCLPWSPPPNNLNNHPSRVIIL